MYNLIKKHFWLYLFEVGFAIFLYNLGLEYFLIYLFITLVIKVDAAIEFFGNSLIITQTANEAKLMKIMNKLKISEYEIDDNIEDMQESMTSEKPEVTKDFILSPRKH